METIQFITTARSELHVLNDRVRQGVATADEQSRYRWLVSSVRGVTQQALTAPQVLPHLLNSLMG